MSTLEVHFGDRCLQPIRAAIKVKEAPAQGKTIFEYAAGTNAADDYLAVVDRIVASRDASGRTQRPAEPTRRSLRPLERGEIQDERPMDETTRGSGEMKSDAEFGSAARALLDRDEVEGVLSGAFYAPQSEPRRAKPVAVGGDGRRITRSSASRCTTTISTRLDEMVDELKARGLTKANRSALIRHALSQVDLEQGPEGDVARSSFFERIPERGEIGGKRRIRRRRRPSVG